MVTHHTFKAIVAALIEVAWFILSGIASMLAIFAMMMTLVILVGLLIHPKPSYANEYPYGLITSRCIG